MKRSFLDSRMPTSPVSTKTSIFTKPPPVNRRSQDTDGRGIRPKQASQVGVRSPTGQRLLLIHQIRQILPAQAALLDKPENTVYILK